MLSILISFNFFIFRTSTANKSTGKNGLSHPEKLLNKSASETIACGNVSVISRKTLSQEAPKPNEEKSKTKTISKSRRPVSEVSDESLLNHKNDTTEDRGKEISTSTIRDRVVADYLKRNGYQDISTEFEASHDLGCPLPNELSLERLITLTNSKTSEEKPLDAWTNIQEGFSDLWSRLNDPQTEVDILVKYILDLNIPVRHVNIRYSHVHNTSIQYQTELRHMHEECPSLKFGRFSRGEHGEDGKIKQNWEELVNRAKINNPAQCWKDLMNLDRHSLH